MKSGTFIAEVPAAFKKEKLIYGNPEKETVSQTG